MTDGEDRPDIVKPAAKDDSTSITQDEWVEQYGSRVSQRAGLLGAVLSRWLSIPLYYRMALLAIPILILPFATDDRAAIRITTQFLAFSILAIGLNVIVGYAGLLDLGYVAFFGVSGYTYAYLSSEFVANGVHVPSIISIPLIIAFTTLVGWLIGSASIRLQGDYLAIVTLGFGQVFVQLANTLTRVKLPWRDDVIDLTRGPNGINELDDISFFGFIVDSPREYYYLFFAMLIITYIVVDRVNRSRIGRAWRAMGEDELATEVMGMPTRRLKLMAFAIGAAIAAFTGTVFAAWQGNVVPEPRYSVLTLINLYAMVVLGGLPGVILGALIITWLPEVLRNAELAGFIFYFGGLLGLIWWLRPWRRLATVLGGTLIGGLLLKLILSLIAPGLNTGAVPASGSLVNQAVQAWLVIPQNFQLVGNIAIFIAILTLLLSLLITSWWKWLLLGIAIYTSAFAWETRLAVEPNFTRILVVGALLIILMITRPQGLLGKLRVQVI